MKKTLKIKKLLTRCLKDVEESLQNTKPINQVAKRKRKLIEDLKLELK